MTNNPEYNKFRRLHLLTIFYRAIVNLPGMMLPLYFAITNKDAGDGIFIILTLVYAIFAFPYNILHYYNFHFLISPHEIVIHSGILSKQQRNISLERVQNIEIQQNFLQKLLGLAKVMIETAGDVQTEGQLEYVSIKNAYEIRQKIMDYKNELVKVKDTTGQEDASLEESAINTKNVVDTGRYIYKSTLKELFLFGMTRFRPLILVIFITVSQYWNFLPEEYKDPENFGIIENIKQLDIIYSVLIIILAVIVALLVSWIADILLTINTYYGFTLALDGNKLNTHNGLFGSRKATIQIKKIQSLAIKSNVITRKIGYYGLEVQTAGYGNDVKQKSETTVPVAKFERVIDLAKKIIPFDLPETFLPVSKLTIRRAAIRYIVSLMVIALALSFMLKVVLLVLIIAPLLWYGAVIRYRFRGYFITDDYVIIRQGFVYQRINIIPIKKIQSLHVYQNLFQKRLNLATLFVDTAGSGSIKDAGIIDIEYEKSMEIMEELAEKFARTR